MSVVVSGNIGPTYSFHFSLYASQTFPFEGSHCSNKGYCIDERTQGLIEEKLSRSIAFIQRLLTGGGMVGIAREFLLEIVLPKDIGWTRYEGENNELEEGSNVDGVRSL